MKIIFITPSLPSQFHRIRALSLIKYLSKSHQIYLVSLTNKKNNDLSELRHYCQKIDLVFQSKIHSLLNCLLFLFSPLPLEIAYCRNKKMNQAVKKVIENNPIDLIYVKRLRSAQFIDKETSLPLVLDTTDAMSLYYGRAKNLVPWFKKPLFYEEWIKYKIYEKKLLARFKNWIVCSPIDINYLKKTAPAGTNLFLIPNGVDSRFYSPADKQPEKNSIIFSGLMDKFVNIQAAQYFVKEIFPEILEKNPQAKLYLVGPKPTAAVKRLAGNNILVTGEVPYIKEYVSKASLVVCPIKTGAGTKNKILQAWSLGRPVITSSIGFEGLEAKNLKSVLVADQPHDFAKKTIALLQNENLQKELINNGYQVIKEKYGMEVIIEQLNKLLNKIKNNA